MRVFHPSPLKVINVLNNTPLVNSNNQVTNWSYSWWSNHCLIVCYCTSTMSDSCVFPCVIDSLVPLTNWVANLIILPKLTRTYIPMQVHSFQSKWLIHATPQFPFILLDTSMSPTKTLSISLWKWSIPLWVNVRKRWANLHGYHPHLHLISIPLLEKSLHTSLLHI